MVSAQIAFVVIGRNEGQRLIACLDALPADRAIAVYVDSGSTDGSVVEAQKRGAVVVQLDLARPFTAGRARNEGFAAAKAHAPDIAFVQFIDGDCTLSPDWLETAAAFLGTRPDVAAVCGRRAERYPDASLYNRLCDLEWDTPIGEADACGGDSLMRVDAFAALGGFTDALIAGEEPELCARFRAAGWKIWRIDAPMTLHDAAMHRFSQWWMRGVRSGFGYAQVWSATRESPAPLYAQELRRSLVWAALLPVAVIVAAAVIHPIAAVFLPGLYMVQIARIASRRGPNSKQAWQYGALMTLVKFAEFQGVLRFVARSIRGSKGNAITYK